MSLAGTGTNAAFGHLGPAALPPGLGRERACPSFSLCQ